MPAITVPLRFVGMFFAVAMSACAAGGNTFGDGAPDGMNTGDAVNSDAIGDAAAPRPVAPLSTATVTSQRPTLHWSLATGSDGARIELCRDRAMTMACQPSIDATGNSGRVPTALTAGVWFWQLRGRSGGATGTATGPVWQFVVGNHDAPVDTSGGTMLDVDGDGFADIAVGAPLVSTSTGDAYIFAGSTSGPSTTPTTTLMGTGGTHSEFGVIASAGDVNGDGFDDVIAAAPQAMASNGTAAVYLGSASGLATTAAVSLVGPTAMEVDFGGAVASAGDVNGDGYADVIVGAEDVANGTGNALLYFGSAAGTSMTASVTLVGPAGPNGLFGTSVAGLGDVNGDGFSDVAVGASAAAVSGSVYVYLGSATGLGMTPTMLAGPDGGDFGSSVSGAGDVNGDGYMDMVVGAFGVIDGGGRAYVYSGSATGIGRSAATVLMGPASGYFGRSVSGAGDVNGDGFGDIVVGADGAPDGTSGAAYVFLGAVAGLAPTPVSTFDDPDVMGVRFGSAVAGAGDVNGDGFSDVIVGAPFAMVNSGGAYLFLGASAGPASTPTTTFSCPDTLCAFGTYLASAEINPAARSGRVRGRPDTRTTCRARHRTL